MCWCTRALARTREGEQPNKRYCSLLRPGARARIRGKCKLQPARRLPNNANTSASSPRSTARLRGWDEDHLPTTYTTGPKGPTGHMYLQCRTQVVPPWPAIDAGGCHGRVTPHSSTQQHTAHGSDNLTDRGDLLQRNAVLAAGRLTGWQDEPDYPVPRADGQTESSMPRLFGPICWSPGSDQCSLT